MTCNLDENGQCPQTCHNRKELHWRRQCGKWKKVVGNHLDELHQMGRAFTVKTYHPTESKELFAWHYNDKLQVITRPEKAVFILPGTSVQRLFSELSLQLKAFFLQPFNLKMAMTMIHVCKRSITKAINFIGQQSSHSITSRFST